MILEDGMKLKVQWQDLIVNGEVAGKVEVSATMRDLRHDALLAHCYATAVAEAENLGTFSSGSPGGWTQCSDWISERVAALAREYGIGDQ
jgi:hypothetical protein